ncbi:MAG TPA: orotate phosphoribosyltransferase, partial [Gammaproteobacteria bacterium]|nr:orotate phosphoribosyltransferase [Gammaproteobacteria bacterium]
LDRQERGLGETSAVREVERNFGVPVISIVNLDALVRYLSSRGGREAELAAMQDYRDHYGAD